LLQMRGARRLQSRHFVPFKCTKSHFVRISFALGAKFPSTRPDNTQSKRGFNVMKMVLCAGVFALATIGLLPNGSQALAMEITGAYGAQSASINIARIRSVLKLTPAQEHYWAPVEAALRDLARKQQSQNESAGLVRRISNRVVTVVLNSAALQRLAVAARPL